MCLLENSDRGIGKKRHGYKIRRTLQRLKERFGRNYTEREIEKAFFQHLCLDMFYGKRKIKEPAFYFDFASD
jgi:hypothetical protein